MEVVIMFKIFTSFIDLVNENLFKTHKGTDHHNIIQDFISS
jgi:hypothetical protein